MLINLLLIPLELTPYNSRFKKYMNRLDMIQLFMVISIERRQLLIVVIVVVVRPNTYVMDVNKL